MSVPIKTFACSLILVLLTSCVDIFHGSTEDPLPMPSEIETNKDRSVKPGDSFFDYCNGSWLKSHPIPASGSIGGLYDADGVMNQRVDELKKSVPDIGRFYELMDHPFEHPDKAQAYFDAMKARYPKPATKEEAYTTMGKMMADGIELWSTLLMPTFNLIWKDGKLMGNILPPMNMNDIQAEMDPAEMVPVTATKADNSAMVLIIRGMGLDPSLFVSQPMFEPLWTLLEAKSLDELWGLMTDALGFYESYVSEEEMNKHHLTEDNLRMIARTTLSYTLSYHLAEQFISPAFKEKYVTITQEIQASLRRRIRQVDWMSETTKNNALDKLDSYGLFVAYPDKWYTDCVSKLSDCETLIEAIHRNNRNTVNLRAHLLGGTDQFSNEICLNMVDSNGKLIPADLTLVNAMYSPGGNCVFIYPAMLLPPILVPNMSQAYEYANFAIIGHEFTHGFDTQGSQYDKYGNKCNWWTVADQMAFEERRENIINCYDHMELDPERAPGVYGDGNRTQTENIADLGGFLATLDAYKAHLEDDGYFGKVYDDQIRKFYESFAHLWCVQYDDKKFDILQKSDVHSHARLRVNGVVMNTDLWYDLYDVDRNNLIYLPKDRRTYIW